MYRYPVIILLLLPLFSFSQAELSFSKMDSLSYQYYLKGDWKKLIDLSKETDSQNIESKQIRQRVGYAYFMSGDYYSAMNQYEKAYEFDQSDDLTKEMLYYSNLYAGSMNTRYHAGNLSPASSARLEIKKKNPVESIDVEFNLKTNKTATRSDQMYYRIGVNSDLGYRVSLYQAYSYYDQTISRVVTQQPEYLALLKFTLSPVWHLKMAYHHLFTNVGNVNLPENLGFIAVTSQFNRFNLEVNGSVLNSSLHTTNQIGFHAGVVLPGKQGIYLNSAIVGMYENAAFRTIFAETAGLKCAKALWAEGNITVGNLKNYSAINSLYVYNSVDPSIFKTGFSLIYFLGKNLTISGNFTFDQMENSSVAANKNYYQYSYSGGIKWKL
ncbi:MAG TPA: hypothetical protein VIK10_04055 [Prolixibacteraceae bacterium]